jgi:hypothetical protein
MILRVGVAVLLVLPTAAFAQGDPGPFGGLFGRTPERVGRDYTIFEVRTGTTGHYQDELGNDRRAGIESGAMAGLMGSAAFDHGSRGLTTHVRSLASYQQHLTTASGVGGTTIQNAGGVRYRVATRLTLEANGMQLYTPFFNFHPTFSPAANPGIFVPGAPYVATVVESHHYEVSGGFLANYAKHSALSGAIVRRETRFTQHPAGDLTTNGVQGKWARRLNRDFSLHIGYGRERIHERINPDVQYLHELIDLGVDFLKTLSTSRRTTFSFTTQTSVLKRPMMPRQYRLNGSAGVTRWFQRTWGIGIQAQRTTDFLPGYLEPLYSDALTATLNGVFSQRVQLIVYAAGGRSEYAFEQGMAKFTTGYATTQVNFGLTRHLGLFGQHAFYHYRAPAGVSPVAPSNRLSRQTFTVGLTAWVPIITQERGSSDPR